MATARFAGANESSYVATQGDKKPSNNDVLDRLVALVTEEHEDSVPNEGHGAEQGGCESDGVEEVGDGVHSVEQVDETEVESDREKDTEVGNQFCLG